MQITRRQLLGAGAVVLAGGLAVAARKAFPRRVSLVMRIQPVGENRWHGEWINDPEEGPNARHSGQFGAQTKEEVSDALARYVEGEVPRVQRLARLGVLPNTNVYERTQSAPIYYNVLSVPY